MVNWFEWFSSFPTRQFLKFFSGSSIKGTFIQSGSGDAPSFVSTVSLPSADLAIHLSDWLKKGDEDLKYKYRQFPD
ncbi:hypothetical protein ECG_06103 [Echinococcus granulosus]|uniref:Ovule protein n=1 Tax=Echinococcus granulosus TaxID=6210 RepID=A0A068X5F3_ECHGR|nr:hypothetical protein ECG_06103 [Echinococcus granulosus]CDS25166.1 hypothetical protein EgrG_002064800 [Echinococcus granulosus]